MPLGVVSNSIRLFDLFRYYKGLPHQMAAITELEFAINKANPHILGRNQSWFKTWSVSGKQANPNEHQRNDDATSISLKVPYEYQLDNGPTGYRECFSSSCAMVARYWGKISGDHEYNRVRRQFGDTTDPKAQILALKALGLHATFEMDGTVEDLENEIRAGFPTPVGWLHKGPATKPTGGGHWSVVTGFTPTHFIHNDPNGQADIVAGGYSSNKGGASIAYSRANWLKRWLVDGPDSGWYLKIRPN